MFRPVLAFSTLSPTTFSLRHIPHISAFRHCIPLTPSVATAARFTSIPRAHAMSPSPSPSPSLSPPGGVAPQSEAAWAAWRKMGSPRYVVAPMVDGSELAFRDLCRRYGAELAYTPMLHSRTFSRDVKYRAEHFTTHSMDRPVVAQFCANDADTLVNAAQHIQDHVDAVDLNLGCPQGIAKKGHYGSFLQDEWDLVHDILSTAAAQLRCSVWCKIRVFDDDERTMDYVRMLQSTGVHAIAVHGRTREQKGRDAPPANWDIIRRIKNTLSIPVIVNGNVRTLADANEALRVTGADAVMSAWALLDNPSTFDPERVAKINRMALAKEYLQLAEQYATPLRMVRLHLFKLFRARLDFNMDLNESIARCRSFDDFRVVVAVLENRCDFDDVSFEQRVSSGDVPEHVVCEKRVERLRKKVEVQERTQQRERATAAERVQARQDEEEEQRIASKLFDNVTS